MRGLKEEEIKICDKKLRNFIGDNVDKFYDRYVLALNNQKVFATTDSLLKKSSQIGRDKILSVGTIIGRFTRSNNFRLTVTGYQILEEFVLYKVWIKDSAEMNYLYGNNALKSHVFRISDSIPINHGVFVYNQNDLLLGFGITAVSPTSYERARTGDVVILRQCDNGEYIRNELEIA